MLLIFELFYLKFLKIIGSLNKTRIIEQLIYFKQ